MPLRLTDGTTTIDLQTAPWLGMTYTPSAGSFNDARVSETAVGVLEGTAANIRAAVSAVETMLRAAWRRQQRTNARVYVEYRPLSTDGWFRSEVFEGTVAWSNNPERRRLTGTTNTVELAISFTRSNFWDGAEVEVQLSTSNQSAATGGRAILNHDDSGTGHDNWVQIASTQVAGDLPGPARIQLTNTSGSNRTYRTMAIALNALSAPSAFVHMLEGEARSSGGTVDNDASASGGQTNDLALSASTITVVWTLSAAQMARTQGRLFRLLGRIVGVSGAITVQPEIRSSSGGGVLWRGDVITLPGQYGGMTDLGAVSLPPGGYSASFGAVVLALICTGTGLLEIDFIQLTPLDGYRVLRLLGPCNNNEAVEDSAAEQMAYVLSGSTVLPHVTAVGSPILLHPGLTQRIMVLAETGTTPDPMLITDGWTVRVWHRPRRLTI